MKFIRAEKIDINCVICGSNVMYQTNYKISNYPIKKYVCHSCCANKNNTTSDLVFELSIYNRCGIISPSNGKNIYNSFITGACRKNIMTSHKFNDINDIGSYFLNIQKTYPEFTQNGYFKILSLIDGPYIEIIGFEKLNDVPIMLEYDLFDEISKLIEKYNNLV